MYLSKNALLHTDLVYNHNILRFMSNRSRVKSPPPRAKVDSGLKHNSKKKGSIMTATGADVRKDEIYSNLKEMVSEGTDATAPPVPGRGDKSSPNRDTAAGTSGYQPPHKSESNVEEWDILTGYLKLSNVERDDIVKGQMGLINPSNQEMVRAAIIGSVGKSNFEACSMLIKLMAYEGFNPVIMINELQKRAESWNTTPRPEMWELTLDGQRFQVTELANLGKDMLFLITLFLTRGNNLRKILSSIDKNVKTPLLVKIQTYKIKSDNDEESARRKRSEKVETQSKEATLSRITSSFPQIALAIVKNTGIRGKVDLVCMQLLYKIKNKVMKEAPAILTHGLIPALLPKEDKPETMELKRFCYFFNVEQTVTLQMPSSKRNIVNEPISKTLENAEKFVNAAINGPLNTDKQRLLILKHLGLYENVEEDIKNWITIGSDLYARAATSGSYYMLQTQLSMEAANMTE